MCFAVILGGTHHPCVVQTAQSNNFEKMLDPLLVLLNKAARLNQACACPRAMCSASLARFAVLRKLSAIAVFTCVCSIGECCIGW
jgi:hypothetical protein